MTNIKKVKDRSIKKTLSFSTGAPFQIVNHHFKMFNCLPESSRYKTFVSVQLQGASLIYSPARKQRHPHPITIV